MHWLSWLKRRGKSKAGTPNKGMQLTETALRFPQLMPDTGGKGLASQLKRIRSRTAVPGLKVGAGVSFIFRFAVMQVQQYEWSRDGKELFYRAGSAMMSVPVDLATAEPFGRPDELFCRSRRSISS